MKLLFQCIVLVLICSCSKTADKKKGCFDPLLTDWLNAKKAEYNSCVCIISFREGIYQNQPIIEITIDDPLCDGYNTVHKKDGTKWFTSFDRKQYEDYITNVKQRRIIWTCSK
jgi:hypothetical protein